MSKLTDCLKQAGLVQNDRAEIQRRASEYRKVDGLKPKEANKSAIESFLNDLRSEYADFETRVTDEGGYVDPITVFEGRFAPTTDAAPAPAAKVMPEEEVGGDMPPPSSQREVEVAAGKQEITPEETAAVQQATKEDYLGLPWRKGALNKFEQTVEGMDDTMPEDILPFVEPGKDGKIGANEIRKAIKVAEEERARVREMMESPAKEVEIIQKTADDAIEARIRAYEEAGDSSSEATAAMMKDVETLAKARDEALGVHTPDGIELKMDMKAVAKGIAQDLSEIEKRRVKQLAYAFKKEGVSANQAESKAVFQVLADRIKKDSDKVDKAERLIEKNTRAGVGQRIGDDGTMESSAASAGGATARAMNTLETGPTKAGIGKSGIQGFLKSGTRISKGSDYTIQGRGLSGLYRGLEGFDEDGVAQGIEVARAQAGVSRKVDPIEFTAVERTRLADRADEPLKSGETGYYDPITDKAYVEFDNMLRARGEKPVTKPTASAGSAPDVASLAAKMREAAKAGRMDELEKLIAQERSRSAIETMEPKRRASVEKANATPVPEGRRLALMSTEVGEDGKADMRVLTNAQLKDGKGVETLIGSADMSEWYVGNVPVGTRSGRRDARLFRSADTETPAAKPETIPNEHLRAMPIEELHKTPVRDARMLEILGERHDEMPWTAADVHDYAMRLESSSWPQTENSLNAMIDKLTDVYIYLKDIAPNGIERSVDTKENAVTNIEMLFDSFPAEDVATMKNIINRLSSEFAPAMTIGGGKNRFRVQSASNPSDLLANSIILRNTDPLPEGSRLTLASLKDTDVRTAINQSFTPRSMALAHEVGHWAYFNILTSRDKLDFWQTIRKNYYAAKGKGKARKLDEEAVAAGLPQHTGDMADAVMKEVGITQGRGMVKPSTNEFDSPQEFFANQFVAWLTQKGDVGLENPKLWQRVTRYVKAIFDRFASRTRIDPDLEVLFAKIIPDKQIAAKIKASKPAEIPTLRSPASPYVINNYMLVEDLHRALEQADMASDPVTYVERAKELVGALHSIANFRAIGSRKNKNQIKKFANDIGKIIKGEGEADYIRAREEIIDGDGETVGIDYAWKEVDGDQEMTIMNLERTEEIADDLADFFADDLRTTGHLDDMVRDVLEMDTKGLRDLEGEAVYDLDILSIPDEMRRRAQKLKPDNAIARKFRNKAKAKRKRKQIKAEKDVQEWAAGNRKEALKSSGAEIPDLRTRSMKSLLKLHEKHRGTKEVEAIEAEIVHKMKTGTPEETVPKTSKEFKKQVFQARSPQLKEMLSEAFESGKRKEATVIIREVMRRNHNARIKRGEAGGEKIGPILAQEQGVRIAVQTELKDTASGITEGIPNDARFTIREALTYITHRNPEVQDTSRTLAYRMFNLMNKTSRSATDEANLLSMNDIYRLSRSTKMSPNATGVMADFTSDEFKMLRSDLRRLSVGLNKGESSPFDLMHEIGHVLMRTNLISDTERAMIRQAFIDADDPIKKTMAKRSYGDMPESMKLERQAEEWYVENWSQYLAERVAKGDVFKARVDGSIEDLELRSTLSRILDRIIEGAAYLLNGMIGRKDIRQTFRRLTLYGDMFVDPKKSVSRIEPPTVLPSHAVRRFQSTWESSLPTMKEKIRMFTGEDEPTPFFHASPNITWSRADDAVFDASKSGNYGAGIYVSVDPFTVDAKYGRRATYGGYMRAWTEALGGKENIDPDFYVEMEMMAGDMAMTTQSISEAQIKLRDLESLRDGSNDFYAASMGDDYFPESMAGEFDSEIASLQRSIEGLQEYEEGILADMIDKGFPYDPGVIPVYVRAMNTFDARPNKYYTFENDAIARNIFRYVYNVMKDNGADQSKINYSMGTMKLMLSGEESGGSGLRGDMLYKHMSLAIEDAGIEPTTARNMLTKYLGEQGYDSIDTIHYNTVDGYKKAHRTMVLIETMGEDGKPRSPAYSVKHQDAKFFDETDNRLYYSEPLQEPVNASVAKRMINGESLENDVPALLQSLEESGTPKGFVNAARSIFRGRALSERELEDARAASILDRTLGANSARMRKMGMNWLADYVEDFSPSTQHEFASRYMPINRLLMNLPDAPNAMKRWMGRSNPLADMEKQPESHTRIMQALRRGRMSRHYKQLSNEELQVYNVIRDTFDQVHKELSNEGAMVGNIKDYVPQVWNSEAIKGNHDDFIEKLTSYYMAEKPDRTRASAREVAEHVAAKIVGDDGLYVPPPVTHAVGVADNLDFQRLIRLDQHPGMYDVLEPYLQNNLDVIMVKYLDGATKRLHQTKRVGTNMHAYADYMTVGQEGLDGVARLLSSPRVFTKKIKGQIIGAGDDSPYETGEISLRVDMPFSNEFEAKEAAKKVLAAVRGDGGTASARQMLMEMMPPDRTSKTYERRVDAIVNGMRDFELDEGGNPTRMHHDEFKHAEGTMRAIQGKQVNKLSSDKAIHSSRAMRAFNNISLLTFTTLTSIPDTTLPLIRSGSMQDWIRGITKYASDGEFRDMIKQTGVAIENQLHSRMIGLYAADAAGKIGKAQNAFFNATMLTPWTDMWRGISGSIALSMFETQRRKALMAKVDGAPLANQPAAYKYAHRMLKKYGLEDYLENPGKELNPEDVAVSKGMIKFANDTIFSPNPNDIPIVYQTPIGALFWQLKSFPLMMGRLVKDVMIKDVKKFFRTGDPRYMKRPGYLLTMAPAMGAAALGVKDVVQMRGGEDDRSAAFRERSFMKAIGYDEEVHGDWDGYLGWYFEGLGAAGGFGFLAEVIHDVVAQADNGAYGEARVAGTILGPTVGTGFSAMKILGGAKEAGLDTLGWGTSDSNSKERAAAREAVGRVPLVGGVKAARESMVDLMAGEAPKKKSKGGGWGKSFTDGFKGGFDSGFD